MFFLSLQKPTISNYRGGSADSPTQHRNDNRGALRHTTEGP